jgi:hypothetical protein
MARQMSVISLPERPAESSGKLPGCGLSIDSTAIRNLICGPCFAQQDTKSNYFALCVITKTNSVSFSNAAVPGKTCPCFCYSTGNVVHDNCNHLGCHEQNLGDCNVLLNHASCTTARHITALQTRVTRNTTQHSSMLPCKPWERAIVQGVDALLVRCIETS